MHSHVSKTGGTEMYAVLTMAFGGRDRVLLPRTNVTGTEPIISSLAPNISVLLDDCGPMHTTREAASRLFSIATVRRPCDYYVSIWAFTSEYPSRSPTFGSSPYLGRSPPFTGTDDLSRFRAFMNASFYAPGIALADFYAARHGSGRTIHCYARTDRLLDDVHGCFDHYASSCGGSLPFPSWRRQDAVTESGLLQSRNLAHRGRCESFFTREEQAVVMAREDRKLALQGFGRTLADMGIDQCCSPPAAPTAPRASPPPPPPLPRSPLASALREASAMPTHSMRPHLRHATSLAILPCSREQALGLTAAPL